MIPVEWLEEASARLSGWMNLTPLTFDPIHQLYLKWENYQVTGSFKARGAFNKVLLLQDWERQRGLVTASAGNHGQGVALAAKQFGAHVIVFASNCAVPSKLNAMSHLGAEIRLIQGGYAEAEKAAKSYASSSGMTWISPYNDGQVIAGQATLGMEIIHQLNNIGARIPETWFVPAGGGGLVSGIGIALRTLSTQTRLLACQSKASPYLANLFQFGDQNGIVESDSLADGLSGAIEEGSLTIPMVLALVNDFILVNEEEIAQAIAFSWQQYHEKIEGSAAVALAAALFHANSDCPSVVVLTGGNIEPDMHARICNYPLQQAVEVT
jgi:threonine dehydratase